LGDARQPLPADIQQLFPSSFVFNEEMGWVPEGWLPEALNNKFEVLNGYAF
jgi:type I restriction enzyme S subunit